MDLPFSCQWNRRNLGTRPDELQQDDLVSKDLERDKFMCLFDEHGAALMALIRRLCGNAHDADDLFQETATKVWQKMETYPQLNNPRAWLMTIGYRAFLDACRKPTRNLELPDVAEQSENAPPDRAVRSESNQLVGAALAELPASYRDVVVLHYTGGLSISETAATMKISEGTVKSRLNAALLKLRRALHELR